MSHYHTISKRLICCMFMSTVVVGHLFAQLTNKPNLSQTQPPVVNTSPAAHPGTYGSINKSYIRTKEALGAYTAVSSLTGYQNVNEATQYFDGLGRPFQTVMREASPGNSPVDIVNPVLYDDFGREVFKYMPFAASTNDGSFKTSAFSAYDDGNFMQTQYPGEKFFYIETEFELSPLSRPLKTFAPGNSWVGSKTNDRSVKTQYLFNATTDEVAMWTIGSDANFENNIPVSSGFYNAGDLYKTVMIDEQGNTTEEYKDKEEKLILKRVLLKDLPPSGSDFLIADPWLCTYYIYDDFDQLRFIISPKASTWLSNNFYNWSNNSVAEGTQLINELCFRYEYDNRGRIIAKKVPGAGWIYIVYDKKDRQVFTQDANMRSRNQWLTTLYDELNRPVMTGMLTYNNESATNPFNAFVLLQNYVNGLSSTGVTPVNYNRPASNSLQEDITINSLQQNQKQYKASNSIVWEPGFNTDNTSDFKAEIDPTAARPASTGQVSINDNPLPSGYSFIALTITYYDDYSFTSNQSYDVSNNDKLINGTNPNQWTLPTPAQQQQIKTKGLTTGSQVRTLPNVSDLAEGIWLSTVSFYDDRARSIQIQTDNIVGGADITTSLYDFSGKVLCTYDVHTNPQNSDPVLTTIKVRTRTEFDHTGKVMQVYKQINDLTETLITNNTYDAIGQLIKKELGKKISDNSYTETLNYDYNIRGWLKGINKEYANGNTQPGNSNPWFGMELNYDWGFTFNQYNGNIAGTKWRSKGDGVQRAYGFMYDRINRLLIGDFSQGGNYIDDPIVNFDVKMGSGQYETDYDAYDENGNILKMQQYGLKLGSSSLIDDLHYNYTPNSNKLLNVIDAQNVSDTKLGDFRASQGYMQQVGQKTSSTEDYRYDDNGNLVMDKNKDILKIVGDYSSEQGFLVDNGIIYNYLNLPFEITKSGYFLSNNKVGKINYIYDATGNKLQKIVTEYDKHNNSIKTVTTTTYTSEFVYETKVTDPANAESPNVPLLLQYLMQEEGRIRIKDKTINNTVTKEYVYDYFIKDHLGNVRMVLTDEQQIDPYPVASLETTPLNNEKRYYSIPDDAATRVNKNTVSGYPTDNTTDPNDFIQKLSGTGTKIGSSIILKVMAGDAVNIRATSWWKKNAGEDPDNYRYPVDYLLTALTSAIGGITSAHGSITATELQNSGILIPGATQFLSNQNYNINRPMAYLNWILFDEQFNYVEESSGIDAVGVDNVLKQHVKDNLLMNKSGYLYVYVSNETPNINVFFDNLQVTHVRGPLLEETHYYPFGLPMAGISSKSADKLENKKKYQQYEWNTDFDLDVYETFYRTYDPQIGRFLQPDPAEPNFSESPYVSMGNNPVTNVDPLGDSWWDAIMATVISIADNTMGSNFRATYQPDDPADFNHALEVADNAMLTAGAGMMVQGTTTMGGGVVLLAAGGAGAPVILVGAAETYAGYLISSMAAANIARGYNYGTKPNDGYGPKHGSDEHNKKVDEKMEEVRKDPDNSNLRKNQTQHDVDGKKVGNNKPDNQWDNKKTGHHTHEVDTKQKSSDNHKKVIRKNDKKVNDTYEVLPPSSVKPIIKI